MISLRSSRNSALVRRSVTNSRQSLTSTSSVGATSFKPTDKGFTSQSNAGAIPTGMGPNMGISGNAITIDLSPMMTGLTPVMEASPLMYRLYRDIYYNDSVAGSAVDMMSSLPFSEFSLGGAGVQGKVLNVFMENIERVNIRTLMPEASTDYLVTGAHISSLVYNKDRKMFVDVIPHAIENCKIQPLPFFSQDPIITVTFAPETKAALQAAGNGNRRKVLEKLVGREVLATIESGSLELDPLSTLYIPRRTFADNSLSGPGTSFLRRILPLYLIEKNLYRGTLIESARRQRGILHASMSGGEDWEPSVADLEFLTELFMNADSDPLGAIIATRDGITVEEIRPGGEFWKVTDLMDTILPYKLRALGISEAFLNGDAQYSCLTGNTFIQTENGLMRIGEIADRYDGKVQDFDLILNSRYGRERCAKWLYKGKVPVIKVMGENGVQITGTNQHRLLTLEGATTDWTKIGKLEIGDYIAVSTKPCVRTRPLKLDLPDAEVKDLSGGYKGGNLKVVRKPEYMTPDLAYFMGATIAEGTVSGAAGSFSNSNQDYIAKYQACLESVFGLSSHIRLQAVAGSPYHINGRSGTTNFDCYSVTWRSKTVGTWLRQLGMVGLSADKVVPDCILQADGESQLAFIAAHLEGDGSMGKDGRMRWASTSVSLLDGIYAILQSHGYNCNRHGIVIEMYAQDSFELYQKISKYLTSRRQRDYSKLSVKAANKFGIPAKFVLDLVRNRMLHKNRHGSFLLDDDGKTICIRGKKQIQDIRFLYDSYDNGRYDLFLEQLKLISKSTYKKLMELFELRYNFVKVVALEDAGKDHVYDLSMKPGVEPAYVANGIVSHNSADQGLTVFIEMLRAYREMMTRKIFYNKLFPTISLVNGYTISAKGKVSVNPGLASSLAPEDAAFMLNDGSRLLIPTVSWAKQLKPEGDQAYMDMLVALSEKGVPVPLRVLAAAGGLNMDELLKQQEEDLDLRKQVQEYQKKVSALSPKPDDGMGGSEEGESESSALPQLTRSAVLNAVGGRKPLLSRDFGAASEMVSYSKTGKRQAVYNQRSANDRINQALARAMKASAEKRGRVHTVKVGPPNARERSPI